MPSWHTVNMFSIQKYVLEVLEFYHNPDLNYYDYFLSLK